MYIVLYQSLHFQCVLQDEMYLLIFCFCTYILITKSYDGVSMHMKVNQCLNHFFSFKIKEKAFKIGKNKKNNSN